MQLFVLPRRACSGRQRFRFASHTSILIKERATTKQNNRKAKLPYLSPSTLTLGAFGGTCSSRLHHTRAPNVSRVCRAPALQWADVRSRFNAIGRLPPGHPQKHPRRRGETGAPNSSAQSQRRCRVTRRYQHGPPAGADTRSRDWSPTAAVALPLRWRRPSQRPLATDVCKHNVRPPSEGVAEVRVFLAYLTYPCAPRLNVEDGRLGGVGRFGRCEIHIIRSCSDEKALPFPGRHIEVCNIS